jgi:uncharacterized protein YjbI with pentapeptide repeats
MKSITAEQFAFILDEHKLWSETSGKRGSQADLRGTYLRDMNLSGVELSLALMQGADLYRANLQGAYLIGANLTGADLDCADFSFADLRNAYLEDASIDHANFYGAIVAGTILEKI